MSPPPRRLPPPAPPPPPPPPPTPALLPLAAATETAPATAAAAEAEAAAGAVPPPPPPPPAPADCAAVDLLVFGLAPGANDPPNPPPGFEEDAPAAFARAAPGRMLSRRMWNFRSISSSSRRLRWVSMRFSGVRSTGMNTRLPMHEAPANFFVIRMGSLGEGGGRGGWRGVCVWLVRVFGGGSTRTRFGGCGGGGCG